MFEAFDNSTMFMLWITCTFHKLTFWSLEAVTKMSLLGLHSHKSTYCSCLPFSTTEPTNSISGLTGLFEALLCLLERILGLNSEVVRLVDFMSELDDEFTERSFK